VQVLRGSTALAAWPGTVQIRSPVISASHVYQSYMVRFTGGEEHVPACLPEDKAGEFFLARLLFSAAHQSVELKIKERLRHWSRSCGGVLDGTRHAVSDAAEAIASIPGCVFWP
jgi:hypothetical protein